MGDGLTNIFVMISCNSGANWATDAIGNTTALNGIGVGCSSCCPVGLYYGAGGIR